MATYVRNTTPIDLDTYTNHDFSVSDLTVSDLFADAVTAITGLTDGRDIKAYAVNIEHPAMSGSTAVEVWITASVGGETGGNKISPRTFDMSSAGDKTYIPDPDAVALADAITLHVSDPNASAGTIVVKGNAEGLVP